jgi:hypothetical protein
MTSSPYQKGPQMVVAFVKELKIGTQIRVPQLLAQLFNLGKSASPSTVHAALRYCRECGIVNRVNRRLYVRVDSAPIPRDSSGLPSDQAQKTGIGIDELRFRAALSIYRDICAREFAKRDEGKSNLRIVEFARKYAVEQVNGLMQELQDHPPFEP